MTEGTVDFTLGNETYQTWYKVVGDLQSSKSGCPLVVLHGGPGATHRYLVSIADVSTKYGIPVVFYDQLGNGNSTHLREKPKEFWTPELFMDELENLLAKLGIADKYDLLGHSWGGMLGSQFAATRTPKGLRRLILSGSPASIKLWEETGKEYAKGLPLDVQAALQKHEDAGTTESQEYKDAIDVFYAKHLCRIQPMPKDVAESFKKMDEDKTVYMTMNGPSEFHTTGSLRSWSVIPELHRIQVPTFVINGRYDGASDKAVMPFFKLIPHVKWYTLAESSHMGPWEEREKFMELVSEFLLW